MISTVVVARLTNRGDLQLVLIAVNYNLKVIDVFQLEQCGILWTRSSVELCDLLRILFFFCILLESVLTEGYFVT